MWVDAPITRTVTMHGLQIPGATGRAPPPAPAPALPPPPPRGVPTGWLVAAGGGVVVLALFLLLRGGNPNDEALGLYTEARARCEAGQFDACTAVLARAAPLARDPTTQRLIDELAVEARLAPQTEAGTAAIEAGRLDDATRALETARALAPDNPRVTKLAARLAAARAAEVPTPPEVPVAVVPVPASAAAPPTAPAPESAVVPASAAAPTDPDTVADARTGRVSRSGARRTPASTTPAVAAVPVTAAPATAAIPASAVVSEAPRPRASISLLDPGAAPPVAPATAPRPVIAALPVGGPPPPPRPEGASSAAEVGFLSVTSAVPGTVYVDGVSTGKTTPLWMFKLTPGAHTVEVRDAAGGVVGSRSVRVEPRGVAPVAFSAPK